MGTEHPAELVIITRLALRRRIEPKGTAQEEIAGLEVKSIANNRFGDQVVGAVGHADSHAEIHFPLWR
jgi:hypothetical protein